MFPLERAEDVALAMKPLMDDSSKAAAVLMMIMTPPPARKPSSVATARFTRNLDDAEDGYLGKQN